MTLYRCALGGSESELFVATEQVPKGLHTITHR